MLFVHYFFATKREMSTDIEEQVQAKVNNVQLTIIVDGISLEEKTTKIEFTVSRHVLITYTGYFQALLSKSAFSDQKQAEETGKLVVPWYEILKILNPSADFQKTPHYNWTTAWTTFADLFTFVYKTIQTPLDKQEQPVKKDFYEELLKKTIPPFLQQFNACRLYDLLELFEYFQCELFSSFIPPLIKQWVTSVNVVEAVKEGMTPENGRLFFDGLTHIYKTCHLFDLTKCDIEQAIMSNFSFSCDEIKEKNKIEPCKRYLELYHHQALPFTPDKLSNLNYCLANYLWSVPLRYLLFSTDHMNESKSNLLFDYIPHDPMKLPETLKETADWIGHSFHWMDIMKPKTENRKSEKDNIAIVQSLDEFTNNWKHFSCQLFEKNFPWSNNIIIAGGSIAHCLDGQYKYRCCCKDGGVDFAIKYSDIDIFILNQDKTAFRDVISYFAANSRVYFAKQKSLVSIIIQGVTRNVQLIMTKHKSKEEILLKSFDLDYIRAAYDGKKVYYAPECWIANVTRTCNFMLTNRSWTLESRLSKTLKKGYAIADTIELPSSIYIEEKAINKSKSSFDKLYYKHTATKYFVPTTEDSHNYCIYAIKSLFKVNNIYVGDTIFSHLDEFTALEFNFDKSYHSDVIDHCLSRPERKIILNDLTKNLQIKSTGVPLVVNDNIISSDKNIWSDLIPQVMGLDKHVIKSKNVLYGKFKEKIEVKFFNLLCLFANFESLHLGDIHTPNKLVFSIDKRPIICEFLKAMDRYLTSFYAQHSKEIFKKELTLNAVENMLNPSVINRQTDIIRLMITKNTSYYDTITCNSGCLKTDKKMFKEMRGRLCSITIMPVIWITKYQFGISWHIKDVKIMPANLMQNNSILSIALK